MFYMYLYINFSFYPRLTFPQGIGIVFISFCCKHLFDMERVLYKSKWDYWRSYLIFTCLWFPDGKPLRKVPRHPWNMWEGLKTSLIYRRIHFLRWLKKTCLKISFHSEIPFYKMKNKPTNCIKPSSYQIAILKVRAGLGWLIWLTTEQLILTLSQLHLYRDRLVC